MSTRLILKARGLPVGTERKRAGGKIYRKTAPHHWELLKQIVHAANKKAGRHPSSESARLAHDAARHLVASLPEAGHFNERVHHRILETAFGTTHGDRPGWDGFKKRVSGAVQKYYAALEDLGEGSFSKISHAEGKRLQAWHEAVYETLALSNHSQFHDSWLVSQFADKGLRVGGIVSAARSGLGHDSETIPPPAEPKAGFKGLCAVVLRKAYILGPDAFTADEVARLNKAFKSTLKASANTHWVPKKDALKLRKSKPFFMQHKAAFDYCVRRMAEQNKGMVNVEGLESYMKNAMAKYGTRFPKE